MEESVSKPVVCGIRNETLRIWQDPWINEARGRWTARLIKYVATLNSRHFGDLNFYVTQMFSRHEYFQKYLFKIGKCEHPTCIYGKAAEDVTEHTFFQSMRWEPERRALEKAVGHITTENVIDNILSSEEMWEIISGFSG